MPRPKTRLLIFDTIDLATKKGGQIIKDLLVKVTLGDKLNPQNPIHRTRLGAGTAVLGIILNLLVTVAKVLVGLFTGSMAIVSDGLHNLTDAFSSVVTASGIVLAGKAPDQDHPHGHGRLEYLIALIIALVVLVVGILLARSAIGNILSPSPVDFSLIAIGFVLGSIGVKLFMYVFYKDIGQTIGSPPLMAASLDSIGDVAVTAMVLVSYIFSTFTDFPIDGIGSFIVALAIIKSGFDMVRDMVSELLGQDLDPEVHQEILAYFDRPEIESTHDLNIHTYGPGVGFATIDAVVDPLMTVREVHQVFTEIEYYVRRDLDMDITIHMDIVKEANPTENRLRDLLDAYVEGKAQVLGYHDERVTAIEGKVAIGVHLVTDGNKIKNMKEINEIEEDLRTYLSQHFPQADLTILIDRKFPA